MSYQECARSLRNEGKVRINAGHFSIEELEAAAALAAKEHASLIIDNLKACSCADIARINAAGGRQVSFADIHLI
jgi:hypothetical protein